LVEAVDYLLLDGGRLIIEGSPGVGKDVLAVKV